MTSTRTVRRSAAVLAAGAAIACVAAAAPADAAVPHQGKIYFAVGGATKHPDVIMHGALNAAGKDDPDHDNYDVLHFAHGSIRIVHPQSQAKFVPYVNTRTCFVSFDESGSFHLNHGTGTYRGIKGSGTYKAHGSAFVPRTRSGACNLDVEPPVEIFTVHAGGTLT